jgi:hypothetical protein
MRIRDLNRRQILYSVTICSCMLLFGITTVFAHLKSLRGFEYLRTVQLERHSDIMQNRATGPSQYRVLPAYLAQAIAISLDVVGLNRRNSACFHLAAPHD